MRIALPPHVNAVRARGKEYFYYQPHRGSARGNDEFAPGRAQVFEMPGPFRARAGRQRGPFRAGLIRVDQRGE
jgi:hypothetical protein